MCRSLTPLPYGLLSVPEAEPEGGKGRGVNERWEEWCRWDGKSPPGSSPVLPVSYPAVGSRFAPQLSFRSLRAEREKSGDRDERKEERSRPSLTPLVPISSPPIPSVPRLPCHLVTTGDRMRWGRVEWAKHRGANERRAEWLRNGSNRSVRSSHLRYRLATFIPHPRYALSPSRFAFPSLTLRVPAPAAGEDGNERWEDGDKDAVWIMRRFPRSSLLFSPSGPCGGRA